MRSKVIGPDANLGKVFNRDILIRCTELQLSTQEYAEQLYHDSVFFAQELWHCMNLNRYGRLCKYKRRMIRWSCEGPAKRGTLAPRGLGKTYFCALVCAAWNLFRDSECKILFISKSIRHAKKSLKLLKQWLVSAPFLRHLYAHKSVGKAAVGCRWDITMIDVLTSDKANRTPSIEAIGIESQLPGTRSGLVIADDIETEETCKTAEGRENVWTKAKELINIATYGLCEILYVGTFFHADSIYCRLNRIRLGGKRKIYHFRTYPILAPTPDESKEMLNVDPQITHELSIRKLKPGDKVFPSSHSDLFIEIHKAHGATHWYRQYMLIPTELDDLVYPLKLEQFIVFDNVPRDKAPISISWGKADSNNQSTEIDDIPMVVSGSKFRRPIYFDPVWAPYERTVMWIDPAGKGRDRTAYCIGSALGGYIWLKEIHGFTPGTGYDDEVLATIAQRALYHRVHEVGVESQFGGGMMEPLLHFHLQRLFVQPDEDPNLPLGWACSVEGKPSRGQKNQRICDNLQGPMNGHRVVLDRKVASYPRFQEQCARITEKPGGLTNDDEIEAASEVVFWLRETIGIDAAEVAKRYKEELERRQWEIDELEFSGVEPKEPNCWWPNR